MPYNFSKFEEETKRNKDRLANEIGGLRTGRASPQLVENITVDYYNKMTPIKHLAAIIIADAKTIVIQPWDKNALPLIEKAISQSQLNIQPIADKDTIRLSLPELTGERRAQLIKIVKEKLEESKVTLRKIRTSCWEDIQKKEKDHIISEDEKFRFKEELQEKVDVASKELDGIAERKIKEIES